MSDKYISIYQGLTSSPYQKHQDYWDKMCDELNKKAFISLEEKKAKKIITDNSKFDKSYKRKK